MSAQDNLNETQFYHQRLGREPAFHSIAAVRAGAVVGDLSWGPGSARVEQLWVHPDHRRQGIATEMWNHAQSIQPDLSHHLDRSDAGDAWAHAVSGKAAPARENSTGTPDDDERRGRFSAGAWEKTLADPWSRHRRNVTQLPDAGHQ